VILALAILTGAIAVLGEAARNTLRNVTVARAASRAQLICESKMAQIVAGLVQPEADQGTADPDDQEQGEPTWLCSVAVDPVDSQGLIAVTVTVRQDLPAASRPVEFTLVRWMTSPDTLTALGSQSSSSSASGSSSSSGGGATP
jgi:hypothetical protein